MESSGPVRDLPQVVSRHGTRKRTRVPQLYPLVAKLPSAVPSGSRGAEQKQSLGSMSCLQVGDLVLEVKSPGFLWREGPSPFLHISSGKAACGGSVLSLGKDKDSCMKTTVNCGPAAEICPRPPQLEGLYLCGCIRSQITVNCPHCLQ